MPRLVIIRHAKAEAPSEAFADHARPLAPSGREDAVRLGERLARAGVVPQVALVSDAVRAMQTAHLMVGALPAMDVRSVPELYEAGRGAYLEALAGLDSSVEVAATLAHEPSSSALAVWLAGPDSAKAALQRVVMGLTTSGVAVLDVPAWTELDRHVGVLVEVLSGKR